MGKREGSRESEGYEKKKRKWEGKNIEESEVPLESSCRFTSILALHNWSQHSPAANNSSQVSQDEPAREGKGGEVEDAWGQIEVS